MTAERPLAAGAPRSIGEPPSAGPHPPLDAHGLRMYRGSFLLVILAESLGFMTLFSARILLAGLSRAAELNVLSGVLISLAFVASAIPAAMALRSIRAGDVQAMAARLDVALGLGLAALLFVVADLFSSTIVPTSRFGGIYLATIGFHAIHILVGLVFLVALRSSARRGRFTAANHWLVEAGVRFWLFVVAAWLAVYVVFYVL